MATGCGGGGGSSAAVVPVPANRPGFDLAKDVHPFDPALVKHWPGLPNVGTSCYVNAGIKLLAAMPGLDPFLAVTPADDAATAEVRTSLRRIINFIRSGCALVGAPERDAMGLVQAVFKAFGNHRDLRSSMVNIRGGGGFVTTVVNSSLRVLNVRNQFTLRLEVKNTPVNHPQPPRALPFSEKVALATYAVDRAQGTETRQSDVPMRALAAAVYRPDHFWAVIRGEDGWYENNDAAPSTRVPPTHLDGLANPNGDLTRNLELVLYQRSDS